MEELKNNFYMETSHLLDVHLRDAVWSWIEDKIKDAKDQGVVEGFRLGTETTGKYIRQKFDEILDNLELKDIK